MKQFWKDAIKDLPFHKITVKMLRGMFYGQDLPLGDRIPPYLAGNPNPIVLNIFSAAAFI